MIRIKLNRKQSDTLTTIDEKPARRGASFAVYADVASLGRAIVALEGVYFNEVEYVRANEGAPTASEARELRNLDKHLIAILGKLYAAVAS